MPTQHGRSEVRQVLQLSAIAALIFASTQAFGGTLRCGESIVERGFTFFEVLERCGKPDLEYAWDQHYVPGLDTRVTEWVYEQGTNRFRRVLRFEEGRLRDVELRSKPEVSLESLE
jgi:hypothetical protein